MGGFNALSVRLSRRRLFENGLRIVLVNAEGGVRFKLRKVQQGDEHIFLVVKADALAVCAAYLKRRMENAVLNVAFVIAVRKDNKTFSAFQGDRRKNKFVSLHSVVGQGITAKVNIASGRVVKLNPVAELSVFVGKDGNVVAHCLGNADISVFAF